VLGAGAERAAQPRGYRPGDGDVEAVSKWGILPLIAYWRGFGNPILIMHYALIAYWRGFGVWCC
jgi:hypothetical protein